MRGLSGRSPRTSLALLSLALLGFSGCVSVPQSKIATSSAARSAAHFYVTRPYQVIPEPDPFIQGVLTAFTEALVHAGYDCTGRTTDLDDEEELLLDLAKQNARVPGTVGIHLSFSWEAPIVGFGLIHGGIRCTAYDPAGQILMQGVFDPPEPRSMKELLLPPKRPDVQGRYWGKHAWEHNLSFFFPVRG